MGGQDLDHLFVFVLYRVVETIFEFVALEIDVRPLVYQKFSHIVVILLYGDQERGKVACVFEVKLV
jgi:hypothetical protein